MSPRLKMWAQKLLARFGLEIHRRTPSAPSRRFLEQYGVDTIFDVGANIGQSALHYRAIGFEHKIVSFEPVAHLFAQLRAQAAHDPLWEVENVALGATP